MAIALVNSAVGAGGANGGTSGAIDTTGATLLVAQIAFFDTNAATVSDSKSNTWTTAPPTARDSGNMRLRTHYVANPTVGTSHTFTVAGTNIFCGIIAAAFSGVTATTPFDQEAGATGLDGGDATFQAGSITPGEDNELVVAGCGLDGADPQTMTIGDSYTELQEITYSNGNRYGASMAYIVQTTAAATNPTWTSGDVGGFTFAAQISSFKVAASSSILLFVARDMENIADMKDLRG